MEILTISHKYPPSIGGMQKQCFELVENLKKRHTIHELIYRGKGSNITFLLTAAWKARSILKREKAIQFVYANDGLMAFFLTPLFWFSKVKMVSTLHGLDVVFPLGFYQSWIKKYLNRCKALIAVSDATAQELISRGVQKEIVFTVRNGFDPTPLLLKGDGSKEEITKRLGIPLENKRVIVSIGRSVKRKGFSWFIENVLPNLPGDIIYIIIGPSLGKYKKITRLKKFLPAPLFRILVLLNGIPLDEIKVHQLIKEQNLDHRVFHLSGLKTDKVNEILGVSDLFVMPNIKVDGDYEGFGLVALEAIMAGTLSIASNTDGIPSAIQNGKNGFLLPPGSGEAWSKKITQLLEDNGYLKNKSIEFREYTIKNCLSWEKMALKYEEIFKNVVNL